MSRNWRTNNNYVTVGDWSWDDVLLKSKIQPGPREDDCTIWTGSMSPSGALFGAKKHGLAQMTQARRLIYTSETKQDVSEYSVTMLCGRQECCNIRHFELKPNRRKSKLP